jgi:hypothetical protein
MCGPKFCSMKIAADVCEYVTSLSDSGKAALHPDAPSTAWREMLESFYAIGSEVFVGAGAREQ